MISFFLLLLQLFLVLILLVVFLGLLFWVWSGFISKSLFIPLPRKIFTDIKESLLIKEGSVVYHLGCGGGRFIFFLAKNNPNASCIGVENSTFLYYVARIRLWYYEKKTGNHNVTIIKSDLLNQSLTNATHVFLYVYPNTMDDLISVFDRELGTGVRLVSASFKFTQKKPIAEVDLGRASSQLVRSLFVYEF